MQNEKGNLIRINQLLYIDIRPTENEKKLHLGLISGKYDVNDDFEEQCHKWFKKLCNANKQHNVYEESLFSKMLDKLKKDTIVNCFFYKYITSNRHNLALLKDFWFSKLKPFAYFNLNQQISFTIKCLLGL